MITWHGIRTGDSPYLCYIIFILSLWLFEFEISLHFSQDNPNCLLIVTPKGGHLGWVAGAEAPLGAPWTDPVVMDFLEHLEKGSNKALGSSGNLEGVQERAEAVHHLEV